MSKKSYGDHYVNSRKNAISIFKSLAKGKTILKDFIVPVTNCTGVGCPTNEVISVRISFDYLENTYSLCASGKYRSHGGTIESSGYGQSGWGTFAELRDEEYRQKNMSKYLLDFIMDPDSWSIRP